MHWSLCSFDARFDSVEDSSRSAKPLERRKFLGLDGRLYVTDTGGAERQVDHHPKREQSCPDPQNGRARPAIGECKAGEQQCREKPDQAPKNGPIRFADDDGLNVAEIESLVSFGIAVAGGLEQVVRGFVETRIIRQSG